MYEIHTFFLLWYSSNTEQNSIAKRVRRRITTPLTRNRRKSDETFPAWDWVTTKGINKELQGSRCFEWQLFYFPWRVINDVEIQRIQPQQIFSFMHKTDLRKFLYRSRIKTEAILPIYTPDFSWMFFGFQKSLGSWKFHMVIHEVVARENVVSCLVSGLYQ